MTKVLVELRDRRNAMVFLYVQPKRLDACSGFASVGLRVKEGERDVEKWRDGWLA